MNYRVKKEKGEYYPQFGCAGDWFYYVRSDSTYVSSESELEAWEFLNWVIYKTKEVQYVS